MGPPRRPARRSLRRRLLFTAVLALLLLLFAEGAAFLGLCWLDRGWFRPSVGLERQRTAAAAEAELQAAGDAATPADPQFIQAQLHPYLGYEAAGASFHKLVRRRSPGTLLVGVFGGSVAHNFFRMGQQPLIAALQQAPAWRDRQVVVHSHTAGGYKQPQQLMSLAYLLALGGEYDVVVNLDGFNEAVLPVTDNLPFGVDPSHPRSWWQFAETHDLEMRRQVGRLTHRRFLRQQFAERCMAWPWRHSFLCHLLWRAVDHQLAVAIRADLAAMDRGRQSAGAARQADLLARGWSADSIHEGVAALWQRSSLQMHRLCQQAGILYLHYLQPNQYVGDKPMSDAERRLAVVADSRYGPAARAGYPYLQAFGQELVEQGVRFRDLTRIYDREPRPVYTDDCCHLNQLGCALIAEQVARDILAAH